MARRAPGRARREATQCAARDPDETSHFPSGGEFGRLAAISPAGSRSLGLRQVEERFELFELF